MEDIIQALAEALAEGIGAGRVIKNPGTLHQAKFICCLTIHTIPIGRRRTRASSLDCKARVVMHCQLHPKSSSVTELAVAFKGRASGLPCFNLVTIANLVLLNAGQLNIGCEGDSKASCHGVSNIVFSSCFDGGLGEPLMKTVNQLLADARARLPLRPGPSEVLRAQQSGSLIVDMRGAEQQERDGLIPGALVICRNVLEWRCDPVSAWRHPAVTSHDLPIILVCDEGYQSSLAAANLQEMGMHRATDMDGGFQLWRSLGLPVVPYTQRHELTDKLRQVFARVGLLITRIGA